MHEARMRRRAETGVRSPSSRKTRRSSRRARASAPSPEDLPGSRPARLTSAPAPQLATLVDEPPEGEGWIHEIKYDGYRLFIRIDGRDVRIITRKGNDWTGRFPTLVEAASRLPVREALIDGEVVKLDASGISSFQALQNAIHSPGERGLHFYAFDLLHLDGYDLGPCALGDRKKLLAELLQGTEDPFRYSDHVEGNGKAFFQEACRLRLEGIVSKRADRPHRPGRRGDWLKAKCGLEQEFIITGWTDPEGARNGFGALLLGVHDDRGVLRHAGKVGTGFSERSLDEILRKLVRLEIPESPFPGPRRKTPRGVHWVRPELVAQIAFNAWTDDGLVRHASFQGLREDKPPEVIVREKPADSGKEDPKPRPAARARGGKEAVEVGGVRVTNPGRVVYPETGATKEDVARYYLLAAERILPHVEGRPLTLFRCPSGRVKGCFFQKHANETIPAAVHRIPIQEEKKKADYLVVDTVEGLVSVIQMGALELHTWGSRTRKLEEPDRLVLDLDPDPSVPWERMVEAAFLVKELLAELDLESFLKTTGGKGLHIVVPLAPRMGWEEVRGFAQALARSMVLADPAAYLDTASKSARRGKIYVDWLRNGRGATAIEAYSTRAREGAPIAMPIRWPELRAGARPDTFTLADAPRRLAGKDPWEGYFSIRQSITKSALAKLEKRVR